MEPAQRLLVLATAVFAAGAALVSLAASAEDGVPTADELAAATYAGIVEEPVTLVDGAWEGEPFVPGGAARTRVTLSRDFRATGDLDGDGADEAIVLLSESSGGSGTFGYVAVVGRRQGKLANLGTAPLGDRVQVKSARVTERGVELSVVQAGPEDARCCPSQRVTRVFALGEDGLSERATQVTGALSLDDLAGVEWVLTHFAWDEPAPGSPEITLTYAEGRVGGAGGCNRYFGDPKPGEAPGELTFGPMGSTRMSCGESADALEARYLQALGSVVGFGFVDGKLALTTRDGGVTRSLLFAPRDASSRP